jgi:uncharacterized protein DUF4276
VRRLSLVVEGDGDQGALPVVLRRYVHSRGIFDVEIAKPINAKGRPKLLRVGELERFVILASRQPSVVAVLVLCDADDDPACQLGPEITQRCVKAVTHLPVRACLAVREFENWFLASPETLAGEHEYTLLDDYETVAAEHRIAPWCAPLKYVKPIKQPALAASMDINLVAQRCPSFARLLRCVDELLAVMPSESS